MPSRTTSIFRTGLAVVLLTTLLACGTGAPAPPDDDPLPVVVPDTTKVADTATRAALQSYDGTSGRLRFATTTPLLDSLAIDDVLVTEPTAAAPHGFLRAVVAIEREGDAVVIDTVQAALTDAVHQGALVAEGELTADDLAATNVYVEGVRAYAVPRDDRVEPSIGVGAGFDFKTDFFDEVVLDFGEGADAQVRVRGEVLFSAGYGVGIDIRLCWRLPPVCLTKFEAKVGAEQAVALELTGSATASLDKEIKVADFVFDPVVFAIGPVPVVIVPRIDVYVGASGTVSLSFEYGFVQTATAQVGARWTPSNKWENITGFGIELESRRDLTLFDTMRAEAYVKPVASLQFYDVAGPTFGVRVAAELDAQFPRDPTWIARGIVEGTFGFVVDVPVIGRLANYEATVFTWSRELATAANEPPAVTIQAPADGFTVELGDEVLFEAYAEGFVGNPLPITWTLGEATRVTQPAGPSGQHALFYADLPPGTTLVSASTTDPATSLEATAQVSVTVTYDPPEVYILHPVANAVIWASEPLLLSGQGVSGPFTMAADQIAWRVVAGTSTIHAAFGHTTIVPGGLLPAGTYQVTLGADDGVATASRTLTIATILKPPEYPTATIVAPEHGSVHADGSLTSFVGTGSDPEDGDLPGTRMRWTAKWIVTEGDELTPKSTTLCAGNAFSGVAAPVTDCSAFDAPLDGAFLDDQGIGTNYTIILEVMDSDGNEDSDHVSINVVIPPVP